MQRPQAGEGRNAAVSLESSERVRRERRGRGGSEVEAAIGEVVVEIGGGGGVGGSRDCGETGHVLSCGIAVVSVRATVTVVDGGGCGSAAGGGGEGSGVKQRREVDGGGRTGLWVKAQV